MKVLNDHDDNYAARILGKIGDSQAVEPLIAALERGTLRQFYGDKFLRENAVNALGLIGDVRAVTPLIKALNDIEKDVRTAAEQALKAIGYEQMDAVQLALMASALDDWDELLSRGEAVVEPLARALKDKEYRARAIAAEALGKIGDVRAIAPLTAALKDSEYKVRAIAVEALGKIGDVRAIEPLTVALNDSEYKVRLAAEEALERIKSSSQAEEEVGIVTKTTPRVRLRSRPLENLSDSDIQKMLKEKDFFDKEWNPQGKGLYLKCQHIVDKF